MANKTSASVRKTPAPQVLNTLKRSSDFQHLKEFGYKIRPAPWLLVVYIKSPLKQTRVGYTIPKGIGTAVTRNRLRRWCREFFRKKIQQSWNPEVDINVVFRPQPAGFYKELEHSTLDELLSEAIRRFR